MQSLDAQVDERAVQVQEAVHLDVVVPVDHSSGH